MSRGRSRGPADALHRDAVLPRARRNEAGRARGDSCSALQGRRSRRRRSPRSPPAASAPRTTTSGSRFTITRACADSCGSLAVTVTRIAAPPRWRSVAPPCEPSQSGACAGSGRRFTDVTAAAGITLHPQQRPGRQEVLPETMGSGVRVLRRRRRRLAGHPARQRQGLGAARPASRSRALYRNNRNGTFTDVTRRQRPRRRDVRHGRRRRRLRQRRPRRRLHHRARGRPPVPQRGRRQVPRRDEGVGHRQRELRHQRGVARLRQGRQARSVRRQLRAVDAAERPLVLARRRHEVVLHAGVVQGHGVEAVSQPGRRPVRGRQPEGRRRRPDEQVARRRGPRLRRRRLARPLRRQRHAAEQAVPQQPERHVHRRRHVGRRGLRRGRRRARRDGRGRRRLRPLGPAAPARRQLLEPDARPLPQRGHGPVRGRGADVDGRPRQPALR